MKTTLLSSLSGKRVGEGGFDGYRGVEDVFQCGDYNTAFIDQEVFILSF